MCATVDPAPGAKVPVALSSALGAFVARRSLQGSLKKRSLPSLPGRAAWLPGWIEDWHFGVCCSFPPMKAASTRSLPEQWLTCTYIRRGVDSRAPRVTGVVISLVCSLFCSKLPTMVCWIMHGNRSSYLLEGFQSLQGYMTINFRSEPSLGLVYHVDGSMVTWRHHLCV